MQCIIKYYCTRSIYCVGLIISTLKRFFSFPKRPVSVSGTHLTPLFNIYWFPFLGGKAPEREIDSPHSKAQVRNVWSYRSTCTPENAFLGSTGQPYLVITIKCFTIFRRYGESLRAVTRIPDEHRCLSASSYLLFLRAEFHIYFCSGVTADQQFGSIAQWLLLASELTDRLVRNMNTFNLLKPRNKRINRFSTKKFCILPTMYLCVFYGFQNKQRLLLYTVLTYRFL
jgi:hypothetical protein